MTILTAPAVNAGIRTTTLKGTIAVGTASSGAQKCVGGLVTVNTGLPAGAEVRIQELSIAALQAAVSTPQSLLAHIFEQNPSASTFTDNATLSLHADDLAKLAWQGTVAIASATGGGASWLAAPDRGAIVDANGRLYFSIASAAASLVFAAAPATLAYRLGLRY